jgi:hypothetical protein
MFGQQMLAVPRRLTVFRSRGERNPFARRE